MALRSRARQTLLFLVYRVRRSYEWGKKWGVFVITYDKVIQALMTGSAVAIVAKGAETVGIFSNAILDVTLGFTYPLQPLVFLVMLGVFVVSFIADVRAEEFREWVESKTGEEAADDSEDGGGGKE